MGAYPEGESNVFAEYLSALDRFLTEQDAAESRGPSTAGATADQLEQLQRQHEFLRTICESVSTSSRPADISLDRTAAVLVTLLVRYAEQRHRTPQGAPPPDAPCMRLGDFLIIREIGRGGMGIVYEAEQESLRRRVALKVLPFTSSLDPRRQERFEKEIQAVASLQHPHIIPVHTVGLHDGRRYYAMDFIQGVSLSQWIMALRPHRWCNVREFWRETATALSYADKRSSDDTQSEGAWKSIEVEEQESGPAEPVTRSRLKLRERIGQLLGYPIRPQAIFETPGYFRLIAHWSVQASQALAGAHAQQIIHRDVKPSNFLVDASGHLYLTDFGLARQQNQSGMTATGDVLGTLRYMSPEQAEGNVNELGVRSDVYSLGATIYELLTLTPAFAATNHHVLIHQILDGQLRPPRQLNPAIPPTLELIVLKAMTRNPANRYASMRAMADDCQRFLANLPIRGAHVTRITRARGWLHRHAKPLLLSSTLALTLLVAALLNVLWSSRSDQANSSGSRPDPPNRSQIAAQEHVRDLETYVSDIQAADQAWRLGDIEWTLKGLFSHADNPRSVALRGFEWYYLRGLCEQQQMTLSHHQGDVYSLAYSSTGHLLASAGLDGTVVVWSLPDGHVRQLLSTGKTEVNCVAFSLDDQRLAAVTDDRVLHVWQLNEGRHQTKLNLSDEDLFSVAFSPNGKWIAVAGCDDTARLLDSYSLAVEATLAGHEHDVEALAFSPYGETLATASWDTTVKLWSVPSGELITSLASDGSSLSDHNEAISVAFAQDGSLLAAGHRNGRVSIWDCESYACLRRDPLTDDRAQGLSFSPDNQWLACSDRHGIVRIVKPLTAEPVTTLTGHRGQVWSVQFSPDGRHLATGGEDGTVRIWNPLQEQGHVTTKVAKHKPQFMQVGPDRSVHLLFDTEHLLTSWSIEAGHWQAGDQDAVPELCSFTLLPGGHFAVMGTYGGEILLWNLDSHRGLRDIATEPQQVASLVYAPGTHRLIANLSKAKIAMYDFDGSTKPMLIEVGGSVEQVILTPDGRQLIAAGSPSTLTWIDLDTRAIERRQSGGKSSLNQVVVSPDGRWIASGCSDRTITVWDAKTRKPVYTLLGHAAPVVALTFSPDSKTLASAGKDGPVRLWNTATGKILLALDSISSEITCLAFSADGKMLVGAGPANEGSALTAWPAEKGWMVESSPTAIRPPSSLAHHLP